MTYDEFSKIAKVMNAAYASNDVMFTSAKQIEVWHRMLSDLDCEVVEKAVLNLIAKSEKKPTIAAIRREYFDLVMPEDMNEQQAWDMVRDGIRNGTYGAVEEFEKFPDVIKKAVGSPMSLTEWAALESSQVETVIQSLFKRSYRAAIEQQNKAKVLGAIGTKAGAMAALTENVAKRLGVDE